MKKISLWYRDKNINQMLIKQTGFICSRRDGHPEHQNE